MAGVSPGEGEGVSRGSPSFYLPRACGPVTESRLHPALQRNWFTDHTSRLSAGLAEEMRVVRVASRKPLEVCCGCLGLVTSLRLKPQQPP